MQQYKIDKSIPIIDVRRTRSTGSKYPFSSMVVGDSFVFDESECKAVTGASHAYGKRHGQKFIVSWLHQRCWRTA